LTIRQAFGYTLLLKHVIVMQINIGEALAFLYVNCASCWNHKRYFIFII